MLVKYRFTGCIVVACALVLVSIIIYAKILPHRSRWYDHLRFDASMGGARFFPNRHFTPKSRENFIKFSRRIQSNSSTHGQLIMSSNSGYVDSVSGHIPARLKIMVLAQMRTGSTLLGEIFNQNPDLFYLFEPLHTTDGLIQMKMMKPTNRQEGMSNLLRKLLQCSFPVEFMYDIYHWGISKGKSRTLQGVCRVTAKCSRANPGMFTHQCELHHGNMAMKLIRANLETIQPLVTYDKLNIRILHLIRDPRGTAKSRRDFYCDRRGIPSGQCTLDSVELLSDNPTIPRTNTVNEFCQWLRETVPVVLQRPAWLRGRYKLIRYEDLAAEPLRLTKDIYEFLRLPLHARVAEWVTTNTQENTQKSAKPFNTQKNSTQAASSWRNSLSFQENQAIERQCADVMQLLGYQSINKEEDLTNLNIPVTLPLHIGSDISLL